MKSRSKQESSSSRLNWTGVFYLALSLFARTGAAFNFENRNPQQFTQDLSYTQMLDRMNTHRTEYIDNHDILRPYLAACSHDPNITTANLPADTPIIFKDGVKIEPLDRTKKVEFEAYYKSNHYRDRSFSLTKTRNAMGFMPEVKAMQKEAEQIKNKLKPKHQETFQELVNQLAKWIIISHSATSAINHGIGNCDEQAAIALMKLVNQPKVPETVHVITIQNSESPMDNHTFILLNSNAKMDETGTKVIEKDKEAVKKFFADITKGEICDGWNDYNVKFVNDKRGYKDGGGADRLSAYELEMNFDSIKNQPEKAQKFICSQLSRIKFNRIPTVCNQFKNH